MCSPPPPSVKRRRQLFVSSHETPVATGVAACLSACILIRQGTPAFAVALLPFTETAPCILGWRRCLIPPSWGVNHKSRLRRRPRRNHGESDTTRALCGRPHRRDWAPPGARDRLLVGQTRPVWHCLVAAARGDRALALVPACDREPRVGVLSERAAPARSAVPGRRTHPGRPGLGRAQQSGPLKEIPMAENQIRELEGQLAVFTANSKKRPGWLPAIEATQARLTEARGKLVTLYREVPRSTARIEVQEILVIAMECVGLLLFQIAAVLAITTLARERRFRLAAEAWHPFGVGRGSAGVRNPADQDGSGQRRERDQRGDVAPGTGTGPRRGPQAEAREVQAAGAASGTWTGASVRNRRAEAAQWLSAPSSFSPLGSRPERAVFPWRPRVPAESTEAFVPWRLRLKPHPCCSKGQRHCHSEPAVSCGRPKGRCRQSINVNPFGVSPPKGGRAPRFFIRR